VQGCKGAWDPPATRAGGATEKGGGVEAAVLPAPGGCLLLVEVQPGSGRPGRLSYDRWRKRIRVAVGSRAERGRADAELLEVLSSVLGVKEGSLRITSGRADRWRGVEVEGLGPQEALGRLAARLDGGRDG